MNKTCECGCGQQTKIATYNRQSKGTIKGEPHKYVRGHRRRPKEAFSKILSQYELGWLVGILEGEGCFSMSKENKGQGRYTPVIRVTSTDKETITQFHKLIPEGIVKFNPHQNPKHQHYYSWTLRRIELVLDLLIMLRPLLSPRRCAKIDEILGTVV